MNIRNYAIVLFLGLISSFSLFAQTEGIEFFHGTFEEAKALAKKERKIIFMDAYAVWCGPCKRMAKDVFTQKSVGNVYNKHFINVKMDMEKGEGPKLAGKYKVSAYPTLLFIDADGKIVNTQRGALPAERFIALAKATLAKNDKSAEFSTAYENGEREPSLLKAYAYALAAGGQPSLKIANEYLRSQKDLTTKENLQFLYDFTLEADGSIFNKLVKHKKEVIAIKGEEAYKECVQQACNRTIEKAVEFSSPDLLTDAKKQMKLALTSFASEYNFLADLQYAYAVRNTAKIISTTDKYIKKYVKKDAKRLHFHAAKFNRYFKDTKALAKAEKWAAQAYAIDANLKYGQTYINLLRKNGKQEEAQKIESQVMKFKGRS